MPLNEPNIGTDSGSTSRKARQADATTQLEVDEVILDYLAYKATKAVLREYQSSKDERAQDSRRSLCALHLDLVDCELLTATLILSTASLTKCATAFLVIFSFHSWETIMVPRIYDFVYCFLDSLHCSPTRQSMTALKPWTRGLSARRTNSTQKCPHL